MPGEDSPVIEPPLEDASLIGGDETAAVAAVENQTLQEPTLNIGGSSIGENTSNATMAIVAAAAVEDASLIGTGAVKIEDPHLPAVAIKIEALDQPTLTCFGSFIQDNKIAAETVTILGDSSVQDNEARHTLTEEKTNNEKMQIIPLPVSTSPAPIIEDTSLVGENAIDITPTKRKRGRPKKILGSPSTLAKDSTVGLPTKSSPQSPGTILRKSKLGRPPGSRNLPKQAAMETCVENLTPQLLIVQEGEDVLEKLDSLMSNDERTILIISGFGSVSSAHIQSSTSLDGVSRHEEGPYNLLNLSGTYGYNKEGRTGFLSVLLGNSNCNVIGGLLAGVLIAAGQIQIFLGNIKEDKKSQIVKRQCVRTSPRIQAKVPIIELPDSSSPSPSPDSNGPDSNEDVGSN